MQQQTNYKSLIIFPQTYPHKYGDQVFLHNEIKTLCHHFEKIYIVHFKKFITEKIETPTNVEVLYITQKITINNIQLAFHLGLFELLFSEYKRLSFKTLVKYFSFIISSYKKNWSNVLVLKGHNLLSSNNFYYSFWMNDAAFMLALAKRKRMIPGFIFRLHGFDLYDELRPDQYIPFRNFNFKYVSKAFTVSVFGYNYLKPKISNPEKLENSYLGTFNYGLNPISISQNVLVSCSSINIQKRVSLIVDSLAKIKDTPITWIHFGEKGDWGTASDLIKYANKNLPKNIEFISRGNVTNQELMAFYKTHPVSAFIHLSETEGGPSIACVEAISFGIPLIATLVKGLKETINLQTGIPLAANPLENEVALAIKEILSPKFQNHNFRSGVKNYWNNNFDAEKTTNIFTLI